MDDAAGRDELAVLVHGLWMGRAIWLPFARRLRRQGYRVAYFAYPSVRQGLTESARALEDFARERPAARVHLVGHSLGGLVVLRMLRDVHSLALGRAVLLGCPVAGCSAAEQLGRSRAGRLLLGAALPQWTRAEAPPTLRRIETGAIAGTRRFGVGSVLLRLPRPNDGLVMVDETVLPGMADHLVLPVSHSGMVVSRRVADEVAAFLRTGRFTQGSEAIAHRTRLV